MSAHSQPQTLPFSAANPALVPQHEDIAARAMTRHRAASPGHRGKRISEAEFRRIWFDDQLSVADIAAYLGITRHAVQCRARRRGLPPVRGYKRPTVVVPKERHEMFARMWRAGVRSVDIRKAFGLRYSTEPARVARQLGLPPRGRAWRATCTLRGYLERQRDCGVDDGEMRRLWEAGLSYADMGEALGLGRRAVYQRCRARGWVRGVGWRPQLTLTEWREQQIAARMAEAVAAEACRATARGRWAA